jgi:hypothetical protein
VGNFFWLLGGRRTVGDRWSQVMASLESDGGIVSRSNGRASTDRDQLRFVTVEGSRRYHVPTCLLVQGKSVQPVREAADLRPCEMCRP